MADSALLPEQDISGGDGDALPTYEDLAVQKGPNSRFGRWRSWVEKRAGERYLDLTPEERARRRERGWGSDDSDHDHHNGSSPEATASTAPIQATWTNDLSGSQSTFQQEPPTYSIEDATTSLPLTGDPLPPSHMRLHHFGSRFLPHTTSQIRTVLPLMGERLLLIGHDEGLSVLDMFPSGNPETSGPADAEVKHIWEGEGVYQLELLEFHDAGEIDMTPHGVVLALVGAEIDSPHAREQDTHRSIRMYNLASLTSLARWAASQKQGHRPLDMRRPKDWTPQASTLKKHKHHSSITKGFKNLIIEQPVHTASEPQSSYQSLGPPQTAARAKSFSPLKRGGTSLTIDSSWDVVDDIPLRWATNYVPLASGGSRLLNSSVQFFELKKEENLGFRAPATLVVALKNNILLYETPKGERAFRFVKEFYTPLQPRSIRFVHQTVDATVTRAVSASSSSSRYSESGDARRFSLRSPNSECSRDRLVSPTSPKADYGSQLSLFVVFEKKAGLIRLADSAVGEVELFEDSSRDSISPVAHSPRRPKSSLEAFGFAKDPKGPWLAPIVAELPVPSSSSRFNSQRVYFVTRGKQTHVHPCPLPTPLSSFPAVKVLMWSAHPSSIAQRVCYPADAPMFLQVVAFGEFGVEVQEMSLSFLSGAPADKGKGRATSDEPICAQADVGGDAGFLCRGGQWHKPQRYLSRSDSIMSVNSVNSVGTALQNDSELGFYGWYMKDEQDWRVFWLGGLDADVQSTAADL